MEVLQRIKRLVVHGHIRFTGKAREEMRMDGLSNAQVIESIVNARNIYKTLRSRSQFRSHAGEKLYVIKSFSDEGVFIYSKGTIRPSQGGETFYIFVSAKVSTVN